MKIYEYFCLLYFGRTQTDMLCLELGFVLREHSQWCLGDHVQGQGLNWISCMQGKNFNLTEYIFYLEYILIVKI